MDFMNYLSEWILQLPEVIYTPFVRGLVVYDPIKTVSEYLVDLINDNSVLYEKIDYLTFQVIQTNSKLDFIAYLLWWILLLIFIAFCWWIVQTVYYLFRNAWKR